MTASPDVAPRFATDGSISQPPTRGEILTDRAFRALAYTSGAIVVLLLAYILWKIGLQAAPAMERYGFSFLTTAVWDPGRGEFGVLAEIWGTLY